MRKKFILAEFKDLFKGLGSLNELFGMLREDICEYVGRYFTELILTKLTGMLERERYKPKQEPSSTVNAPMRQHHPQGDLRGYGKGTKRSSWDLQTQVLPRGHGYKKGITEGLSLMFLTIVSLCHSLH